MIAENVSNEILGLPNSSGYAFRYPWESLLFSHCARNFSYGLDDGDKVSELIKLMPHQVQL
jgi:hypothetical protein